MHWKDFTGGAKGEFQEGDIRMKSKTDGDGVARLSPEIPF
jgi:hypothetical protein